MHTLKKFIKYYGPYKAVFFIDLLCATIISLVDLAYPQILRSLTKTLFVGEAKQILSACAHGARYAQGTVRPLRKAFVFLL